MSAELGGSQISSLLEALPGIASVLRSPVADALVKAIRAAAGRSEEHTSELQSRLHLVCRLLLEKKKKKHFRSIPQNLTISVPQLASPTDSTLHDRQRRLSPVQADNTVLETLRPRPARP